MTNWFARLVGHTDKQIPEKDVIKALPFYLVKNSELLSDDRLHVVHKFCEGVNNQLHILQSALGATSVVLFWSGPGSEEISIYAISTHVNDCVKNTFPLGSGVIGALKECTEISLAPYQPNSPAIPYYSRSTPVGSFFACTLPGGTIGQNKTGDYGILCIDRLSTETWSPAERTLISACGDQIMRTLALSRDLLFTDVERKTLQLVFEGLRTLNSALDLESVYRAANQALGLIVSMDVFAVSLIHDEHHELCYLSGDDPIKKTNRLFLLEDSLVGQVVKYRRILPENTSYNSRAPIINGLKLFDRYKSVLVVPLLQEDSPVSGVLILAAEDKNLLTRNYREMIEMIAAQVAIKIDLARSHEKIQLLAITDPLTGIANRRAFNRAFTSMYERACRRNGSFSLVICDIDLFKQVNDIYGHPFGDKVIQQVAKQLKDFVRSGDLAARIGGEEFAILLEDTGRQGAFDVAERIRESVQHLGLSSQGKNVSVTISAGVAAFPQDTDNKEKLFNYADQALYRAKEKGRNQTIFWHDIN
ncbi:MAG: sensor domain-containing diguanylate cyclase [Desulfuromusa sp.]|jgi:diguanylate cyclase (GGDEF)-like protein|nr:sensor domain-containing diguanylate cyclase [Desulfuromusa sp.]